LVICFPECFVPGYRWPGRDAPPPDPAFLERAWAATGDTARRARIAVENTCYFASVNCASEGSATTSAVVRPDGTLQCYQPYGHDGLLVADLDLSTATGLLASRCRSESC